MKLNVLAHGNVRNGAAVAFRKIGNGAQLIGTKQAVGEGNAEHEELRGFSFAARAARGSSAVTLGVDPPPLEVSASPFGQNRIAAEAREFLDLFQRGPRVLLALQALHLLRLSLFLDWCRQ